MTTHLSKFNNTIFQLIENLQSVYNNNNTFNSVLEKYKNKFELLVKINPSKSIDVFFQYAYKYKNEIMNEDEKFFLGHDCKEDVNDENYINNALKLKDIWQESNDNNLKKSLFTYFKVLIVLTERYINEKIKN